LECCSHVEGSPDGYLLGGQDGARVSNRRRVRTVQAEFQGLGFVACDLIGVHAFSNRFGPLNFNQSK
jgi:hypothetical protein